MKLGEGWKTGTSEAWGKVTQNVDIELFATVCVI